MGLHVQVTKNPRHFLSQSNIEFVISDAIDGFNILWETSNTSVVIQDCYDLGDSDWFTGKEGNTAEWPVQKSKIKNSAYIVSNTSSISEPYWLNSQGGFLFVNETTPLFVDQNNILDKNLCFQAKIDQPYIGRSRVLLNYTIVANQNATAAHKNAVENFLGRTTGKSVFNNL